MKKLIIIAAAFALVAAGTVALATSASQASQAPAAPENQNSSQQNKLSISGSVVAGLRSTGTDRYVSFDFTIKNHGRTVEPGDTYYTFSGAKYVDIICPEVDNGGNVSPDTPACEPGDLPPGQTIQSAIIVRVPFNSRATSVVVTGCATEENDQVAPQCATLSIPVIS